MIVRIRFKTKVDGQDKVGVANKLILGFTELDNCTYIKLRKGCFIIKTSDTIMWYNSKRPAREVLSLQYYRAE